MLVALFGVACTSEASPPVSTAQLTTTVAETNTTTEPATTTTTEPTTTAPPTSSQEEIEAELIAVLDGINDLFEAGPDGVSDADLELVYAPERAEKLKAVFAQDRSDGLIYEGRLERLSVEEISVDGVSATLIECAIDRVEISSPDGEVLFPADDTGFLRVHSFEFGADNQWRVSATTFGEEKTACAG